MVSVRDAMPDYVKKVYREVELEQEINGGAFLDLKAINKMLTPRAVQIGTVGEILGVKKKKVVDDDVIDEVNFRSVLVEKAVEDAVKKAKMLKMPRKEVVKQNNVERSDLLELPAIALHGRNFVLNELMSWRVLRRLMAHVE